MDQITNRNEDVTNTDNTKKLESAKALKFNPFDREFHADPYPTFHRLRSEDPLHRYFIGNNLVITRYCDVKAVLRSGCTRSHNMPEFIEQTNQQLQKKGKNLNALAETSKRYLFYLNPPDHTRMRSLVAKAFSPVVVERMRLPIQEIVDELLDKVRHAGTMDVIADLASPLPVTVISRMLGIPNEPQDKLYEWANILSRLLDSPLLLSEYEAMNKVIEEFQEYLRDLIAEREKEPKEDLISALIAVREQNDKLSKDELLSICILLFITGEETTVNTIGNGMLALLRHPEQMSKLTRSPTIIQSAVEEILRYDSPVQISGRIVTDNIEIGNQTIQAGENLVLCLGAANRDPAVFPNPDRFDINRSENNHLAFGDGIHYCLGSALARLEAQIAISTLVQQFPNLKLASDKLEWRKNIALRGLKALTVTFSCE